MSRTYSPIVLVSALTALTVVGAAQPLPPNGLRGSGPLIVRETGPVTVRRELHRDSFVPTCPGYIGCFKDLATDRVMEDLTTSQNMTSSLCREHCLETDPSHEYYATQYGKECWCGTSSNLEDYDKHGLGSNCTMECTGDPFEPCGGVWQFNLFQMTDAAVDHDETPSTMSPSTMSPSTISPSTMSTSTMSPSTPSTDAAVDDDDTQSSATIGDMQDLLVLHNAVRCIHGTDPLSYNETIAETAASYAATLTSSDRCDGTLEHSTAENRNYWGENLYMCGTTGDYDCYSASEAMYGFYDEEVLDATDGSYLDTSEYGGHATQILWNNTESVGCAVASCESDGWRYNYLVCNYDPAGNVLGGYDNNVEAPSESSEDCGYVEET